MVSVSALRYLMLRVRCIPCFVELCDWFAFLCDFDLLVHVVGLSHRSIVAVLSSMFTGIIADEVRKEVIQIIVSTRLRLRVRHHCRRDVDVVERDIDGLWYRL